MARKRSQPDPEWSAEDMRFATELAAIVGQGVSLVIEIGWTISHNQPALSTQQNFKDRCEQAAQALVMRACGLVYREEKS